MTQRRDQPITIDWEDGRTEIKSGAEIYKFIFESRNPIMISANGTMFTTEFEGVIPGLLKTWYQERTEMQNMKKKAQHANNEAEIEFWDKRQLVKKLSLIHI